MVAADLGLAAAGCLGNQELSGSTLLGNFVHIEEVAAIFSNLRDRFLGRLPKYSKIVGVFGRNPLTALPVLLR